MLSFKRTKKPISLASKILIGMVLGFITGFIFQLLPSSHFINTYIVQGTLDVIGKIFITLLEMLVIPIVFVSLVSGVCSLGSGEKLGRLTIKVLAIFLVTTAIAVSIGLIIAIVTHLGSNAHITLKTAFKVPAPTSVKQTILNLVPSNPIQAMASGNLLQVILFALLFGLAISLTGRPADRIATLFNDLNKILMKLIEIVMLFAPYGVFALITVAFANIGFNLIEQLFFYCLAIIAALIIQQFGIYSLLLIFLGRLNPIIFFKKMLPVMLFAFSISSSNATIPYNLEVLEEKLGVDNSIASFTIPLGATINMDGTAIMQGVASIFIAHIYHISLSFSVYIAIIATATLASIGTAGVPGVGIITLAMVLQQAGLPLEGIGLLIGIDRLMDMLRTIVNVTGDTMTACIVGRSEKAIDLKKYKAID